MQGDARAWGIAIFAVFVPPILMYLFIAGSPGHFSIGQIDALAHALDVSIALVMAYVALNRFRVRHEVEQTISEIRKSLGLDDVILTAEAAVDDPNEDISDENLAALLLMAYSGDERALRLSMRLRARIERCKLCNSIIIRGYRWFLEEHIDRKFCICLLVALCSILIWFSCMDLRKFHLRMEAHIAWIFFYVILLGFIVPSASWVASWNLLGGAKAQIRIWTQSVKLARLRRLLQTTVP